MSDSMTAETVQIPGHNGDSIEAYLVRPVEAERHGGVVLIHHMPGYDRGCKENARHFAEFGYDVILPNLYWREAPGAEPDDAAAAVRAQGGVPDERLIGDVAGAAAFLRGLPTSNGKVGVCGYCSGGRQSVLAACHLDLDAAIDCYGGVVTGVQAPGARVQRTPLTDQLPGLRPPLLGLFGNDDKSPSPANVDELEAIMKAHGKTHEFYRYDDTGHGFFAADRPGYRQHAATDGWQRIKAFYGRYLSA